MMWWDILVLFHDVLSPQKKLQKNQFFEGYFIALWVPYSVVAVAWAMAIDSGWHYDGICETKNVVLILVIFVLSLWKIVK